MGREPPVMLGLVPGMMFLSDRHCEEREARRHTVYLHHLHGAKLPMRFYGRMAGVV
jgi:hypothetical protein